MGFENTDKKTAQEVPLLFQSSALILLYIQVRLGRYQPQGLPTALGPRHPKPQHTWNSLPVSTRGGEGEVSGGKGNLIHSLPHTHHESPTPLAAEAQPSPP